MDTKSCGTCAMCCKVIPISGSTLKKPAGKWCSHARPGACGGACSVYVNRPTDCSSFECAWLTTPQLGDEMRPDRIGAVITADGKSIVMFCAAKDQTTIWRKPALMHLIGVALQNDNTVMVTDGTRTSMFERTGDSSWALSDMISVEQQGQKQYVKHKSVLATGRF